MRVPCLQHDACRSRPVVIPRDSDLQFRAQMLRDPVPLLPRVAQPAPHLGQPDWVVLLSRPVRARFHNEFEERRQQRPGGGHFEAYTHFFAIVMPCQ